MLSLLRVPGPMPKFPTFFRPLPASAILSPRDPRLILSDLHGDIIRSSRPPGIIHQPCGCSALCVGTLETSLHASNTATFPITIRNCAFIMVSRRNKTLASLSLFLALWAWSASAAAVKGETAAVDVGALTPTQIEQQLQVINQGRVPVINVLKLTDIRTALSSRLSMLIKLLQAPPGQA